MSKFSKNNILSGRERKEFTTLRYSDIWIYYIQLILAILNIVLRNPWYCISIFFFFGTGVVLLLFFFETFDQNTTVMLILSSTSGMIISMYSFIVYFPAVFEKIHLSFIFVFFNGCFCFALYIFFMREKEFLDMSVALFVIFEGLFAFLISSIISKSLFIGSIVFSIILIIGEIKFVSSTVSCRNNNGGLFFIVKLPFLPVYHISMDADGFVRGCSTVMRYNTIPCAERKLIFSEELMDVRFKMKPGRIYIFETFKDVIKEMKTFRINNTRIAVVKKQKLLIPDSVHNTYRKLFGDKWRYCSVCAENVTSKGSSCEFSKHRKVPYRFFLKIR